MKNFTIYILVIGLFASLFSCRKEGCTDTKAVNYNSSAKADDGSCVYAPCTGPTPYKLDIPDIFKRLLPAPVFPANNPMTVEGVALGKKLFFDKKLSGDNTLACAGCHFPEFSFVDTARFSIGIDFLRGTRNAMPIFNIAWNTNDKYFWDGRANGVEEQVLVPVTDPVEMHDTWSNVVSKLQADANYPAMFKAAFGTSTIDSILTTKAIAQYERTLVSGNAKFDKYILHTVTLTPQELTGFQLFMSEAKGDCFHCHGDATNPLWTDNDFHNNGLDSVFTDNGLGDVTGNPADIGKFKTPSLRNLKYTAPYMHDGRFKTLEEVLDHYSHGLQNSATIDPLMKKISSGGVNLNILEKQAIIAFLNTLNDQEFIDKHK